MIELRDVSIRSGSFRLADLRLRVAGGQYVALMGKSGAGKTTILEAICGLRRIERGRIYVDETDVTDWQPGDRRLGYVPQDRALFPAMTVREHLHFALRLRRVDRHHREARTAELARLLGLEELLDRTPGGLSGGEAQRVALGRALSFKPRVLLMDEPLSGLDETARRDLQAVLVQLKQETEITVIHVTHHAPEALALADRIVRLEQGQLEK